MGLIKEISVGEIAAQDYRKVEVFKKYGIDFCCGGKKSLSKVCREKGISQEQLEKELHQAENATQLPSQNFNLWDLGFLSDYIVQTHHKYVVQAMAPIFEYTQKVARVHGHQHPEVIEAANLFVKVMNELNQHMIKEEQVLFPYIKKLAELRKNGQTTKSPFGSVVNPIAMMEDDHETVGELMNEIRKVTGNYAVPEDACNSFRYAYAKLQEFEIDLLQHIHLENNILFPKAVEMELAMNN